MTVETPPNWNDSGQGERDIYKAALDFIVAESDNTWARFNAMLVVHAILIAVSANLMFGENHSEVPASVPLVLLLTGLVVCFAWWASIERGIKYQDRYVDFAKALEAHFPAEHLKLLTDGSRTKMTFPSTLRTRHTQRIVISVFAALYIAALAYAALPMCS